MSIERRLKKLERQVRKASVRFVIRTWEDHHEAHDAIARELGYSCFRDIRDISGIMSFCRRYKELKERGALIETAEYHQLKEKERRRWARRGIRLVYCRWKEALTRVGSSEKERLRRAYCEAWEREDTPIGPCPLVITDEHIKAAWENMPEGREMEQWLEKVEAEYPAEERERWKEERRARIKAQVSDSD